MLASRAFVVQVSRLLQSLTAMQKDRARLVEELSRVLAMNPDKGVWIQQYVLGMFSHLRTRVVTLITRVVPGGIGLWSGKGDCVGATRASS